MPEIDTLKCRVEFLEAAIISARDYVAKDMVENGARSDGEDARIVGILNEALGPKFRQ